jgi:RNA polymerase sigma-70 factor (ECF subfamily)
LARFGRARDRVNRGEATLDFLVSSPSLTRSGGEWIHWDSMVRLMRLVRRSPEQPSVEDELQSAAGGDARAMRTLLVAVGPELLRVVRRLFGSRHAEVEDVAQECAVALVQALPRFRGECSTRHFAARVALQKSLAARRRSLAQKRALPAPEATVLADETAIDAPCPEQRAMTNAKAALVRALCDELPPAQAEALALHFVLGYTAQEAAELLGVPLETLRSRLRLAKAALRARVLSHPALGEQQEETA